MIMNTMILYINISVKMQSGVGLMHMAILFQNLSRCFVAKAPVLKHFNLFQKNQ